MVMSFSAMRFRARSTCGAASRLSTPTEGQVMPNALATATPSIALRSIASCLWAALMPVQDAMNRGLPVPGVSTRPTVVTPRGKG